MSAAPALARPVSRPETPIRHPARKQPDLHPEPTHILIAAATNVQKPLGPGPPEKVHYRCLRHEPHQAGTPRAAEARIPVIYGSITRDHAFTADARVLADLKAVEHNSHLAPVLTNLRLSDCSIGLPINVNARLLASSVCPWGAGRRLLNLRSSDAEPAEQGRSQSYSGFP